MNYKLVLKTYAQLRQLTDDESALLSTLRGMTDAEREMTVEAFGGSMGKASSKSAAKPATKKFKKCDVCGVSKRAAHHRDVNHKDYHEFDEGGSARKSARASLASVIQRVDPSGNHKPLLCDYSIDGKVCHGEEADGIHDKSLGYGGYHPFSSSSTARNAVGQSSTGEQGQSSETDSEDVSVAAGG